LLLNGVSYFCYPLYSFCNLQLVAEHKPGFSGCLWILFQITKTGDETGVL